MKIVSIDSKKVSIDSKLITELGINPAVGDILDVEQVKLDRIFEVNVKCSFLLARMVVPYMELNG